MNSRTYPQGPHQPPRRRHQRSRERSPTRQTRGHHRSSSKGRHDDQTSTQLTVVRRHEGPYNQQAAYTPQHQGYIPQWAATNVVGSYGGHPTHLIPYYNPMPLSQIYRAQGFGFNTLLLPRSCCVLDFSASDFCPKDRRGAEMTLQYLHTLGATDSPLSITRLVVTSELMPRWPITVSRLDGRLLTVGDVLKCLYDEIRKEVSREQLADLGKGLKSKDKELETAMGRWRKLALGSVEGRHIVKGKRKADCLGTSFMFNGLVKGSGGQGFEHVELLLRKAKPERGRNINGNL